MAKGPNTIYKQCVALARDKDKSLARCSKDIGTEDVIREINTKYGYPSMLETDVKRVFFENNYGDKKTDKALKQWVELGYVARIRYLRYWTILFMDYTSALNTKGAE